MADQEGPPYKFYQQGEKKVGNSSYNYTGRGYAIYGNGQQYDGQYLDGVRQGKGKYMYANGDKYEGGFKKNKKHGIGKLLYKDKGQYYGQWQNGVKHGEGTYRYINNDTYSGTWMFGKKNGQGVYIFDATKMKLMGVWKDDKIQQGKWIFTNGSYYQGKFKDNKPNGEGTWHLHNGSNLSGEYKQTVIQNQDPDDTKVNVKLDWQSNVGLTVSAFEINKHEIF